MKHAGLYSFVLLAVCLGDGEAARLTPLQHSSRVLEPGTSDQVQEAMNQESFLGAIGDETGLGVDNGEGDLEYSYADYAWVQDTVADETDVVEEEDSTYTEIAGETEDPVGTATSAAPTNIPNTPTTTNMPSTPPPTTAIPTHPPMAAPEVNTPLGTARGKYMKSLLGRTFNAFMSIPYAMPPVGDLRFQYPKPFEGRWPTTDEGYYDATYLKSRCPQISLILNITAGREDCLHVSVYTPKLTQDRSEFLPVMVWIHGGAYMTGDSFLYVPTKLMDRDVVVVTVQYRLGSLGFLAGGLPDSPGNMGLMDQITALRWVQDYIEHFGGNRSKVTVFGQSAGGASTSWMQMTPLTSADAPANKGRQLLHQVIPHSGSALEQWTIDPYPEAGFWLTAETLGCAGDFINKKLALKCMRDERTMDDINWASIRIYADDRGRGGMGFSALAPVVQKELVDLNDPAVEVVIPKSTLDIVQNGEFLKVPVMTGSVRDEGGLVTGLSYKDYMLPNGHYINDTDFLRNDLIKTLINAFGIEDQTGSVTNSMRMTFLPHADLTDWFSMVGGLVDMTGMLFLKSGLWQLAHHMNRAVPEDQVPIYFYSWEFEADDSLFPFIFISVPDLPIEGGVSHADELIYLFHLPGVLDERQKAKSQQMLTLWTNFAKYGDPTPDEVGERDEWAESIPKWKPFSIDQPNFMLITDDFTMMTDFETRWNYHINGNLPTTQEPSTTPSPELVPKADYDEQVYLAQQFEMATAFLGALGGCTLIIIIGLTIRLRKLTTV